MSVLLALIAETLNASVQLQAAASDASIPCNVLTCAHKSLSAPFQLLAVWEFS
jgi:hypothetical protein